VWEFIAMMPTAMRLALASCAIAALCGLSPKNEPAFRFPERRFGAGSLRYRDGLPVLVVAGGPEEIGAQVAHLAVMPALRMSRYPREMLDHYGLGAFWPQAVRRGRDLLDNFPPDHRRELEATIAAATTIERDALVAGNTLFDIKKILGCASLVVESSRSRSGQALLGRNLDFPTLGYLQDYSLVTVYRPAGKHAFVSVGFPGMVGCLSGMNDAGLVLTMHEVYFSHDGAAGFDPRGVPYALAFRRVLEECTTLDQAESLLQSIPRTTATNLALCDGQGHAAILEITPKTAHLRPAEDGLCWCTNHFVSRGLAVWPQPNLYTTVSRYRQLAAMDAKSLLRRDDVEAALHMVNKGSHTLQSMIWEPQTLTLHLAIGSCPTSARKYRTLPLGTLLRPPNTPR
jgi:hypothetical protein